MAPGAPGDLGLTVPRAVVEEPRLGKDNVTVQPTVVETAMVIALRRDNATLTPVS